VVTEETAQEVQEVPQEQLLSIIQATTLRTELELAEAAVLAK
jgi:hypothetical protein